MTPTRFASKTTPWRVIVPARFSSDGKCKAHYFKTKPEAEDFCKSVKLDGSTALALIPKIQEDSLPAESL